ncbi:uncharacterized protein SCHCODRAFT_02622277 [Schizophyllum commune H4-8]|uniref:uncharacterized protein n=1 Tax=Schizophyllum commune (strain H4-8 / FGSC 9210) TaxID=578458 RepID=UPI0021602AAF|nr:uncharacterized protein SCHCODRAFT_02622277 [Schizophyllum commune H4-8]KAI5893612.1 hypothetical protein SCHCODRAFT_02622277 [Schizophyllum commune H4-8]
MSAELQPKVRVVVRLPWNRPDVPLEDPPNVVWTAEKADILWKAIEQSRSRDARATDYKALAARLDVPLPYLLYRVHARFQEELKGLQDLQGALSSLPPNASPELPHSAPPTAISRAADRLGLSSSRLSIQPNVRARLNSLGHNSPTPRSALSSSTLTIQKPSTPATAPLPRRSFASPAPVSPHSDGSNSDSDDSAEREDEADRSREEQEALDRKLEDLTRMMTNETLGLVSAPQVRPRPRPPPLLQDASLRGRFPEPMSTRSGSTSQSLSSAGSGQGSGSIPEIPSPSSRSQPASRHMSPTKSSANSPAVSPRHATQRYRPMSVAPSLSETSSKDGSTASSFSDLSDLSTSALESAMANTRAGGHSSRFSAFGVARSRFGPRNGIPQ